MHTSRNSPMTSWPFRAVFFCYCIILFVSQALRAGTEYTTIKPVTIEVSGQKVELKEGQKVTVMGLHNGMAVIQIVLPDGGTSIVQSPESNFQAPAPQPNVTAASTPLPEPVTPSAALTTSTPLAPVTPPAATAQTSPGTNSSAPTKTKEEVDAIIEQAGNIKPDWWDSTSLTIPPNLDLSWRSQGKGPTDIGAYLWNVIQPNASRWKEGVKLVHEARNRYKGDPTVDDRSATTLALIYTQMLSDFPRGAFWAKKSSSPEMPIILAECYMKLGCPSAAIDVLNAMGSDQTRHGQAIKLWADLGNLDTALAWAEKLASSDPTVANLAAGDACRRFGKIPEALAYYQKVLDVSQQVQRDDPVNKKRAAASIAAIKLFDSLDLQKIPDGTYKSDSIGYVGPVEVTVTVQDHKIMEVKVTNHHEKQFYSSLVDVPPQIVAKQSVKGIDTTTGATVTSEAIIYATAKALSSAQNGKSGGTPDGP